MPTWSSEILGLCHHYRTIHSELSNFSKFDTKYVEIFSSRCKFDSDKSDTPKLVFEINVWLFFLITQRFLLTVSKWKWNPSILWSVKNFFKKSSRGHAKKITPLHGKIIAENAPKNVVFCLKTYTYYILMLYLAYFPKLFMAYYLPYQST